VVTEAAQYECSYRRTAHHATGIRYHSELRHIPLTLFAVARKPIFSCSTSELGHRNIPESSTDDLKRGSVRLRDVAPRYLVDLAASADGRHQSRSAVPGALLHGAVYWPAQSRNDYPQLFNRQNLHSLRSSAS